MDEEDEGNNENNGMPDIVSRGGREITLLFQ